MHAHRINPAPRNLPSSNFSGGTGLVPRSTGQSPLHSGNARIRIGATSVSEHQFPTCSICNKRVDVATTSLNELGRPIHEECHALKDSLKKATAPATTARQVEEIDNPSVREIIEVLNSAQNDPPMKSCPTCGSNLGHQNSVFMYRGKSWQILLPICTNCHSDSTTCTSK